MVEMYDVPRNLPEHLREAIEYLREDEPETIEERRFYMDIFAKCHHSVYNWCVENDKSGIVACGVDNISLVFTDCQLHQDRGNM